MLASVIDELRVLRLEIQVQRGVPKHRMSRMKPYPRPTDQRLLDRAKDTEANRLAQSLLPGIERFAA